MRLAAKVDAIKDTLENDEQKVRTKPVCFFFHLKEATGHMSAPVLSITYGSGKNNRVKLLGTLN